MAAGLLSLTGGCLVVGGILHLTGAVKGAKVVWTADGVVGAGYCLWTMVATLRQGRLGVDIIALLALVGALAVGEYLVAALIAVMVASGQALEGWAAGRAHPDLKALLERAPRSARRYDGETLHTVPVATVDPATPWWSGPVN
jgi:cation transport ATPase